MTRQSNVSAMHKNAGWQIGQDTGWAMLSPSWAVVNQGRNSLNWDVKDRNNLEFSFVFGCLVTQLCLTLCNIIGCSLPDSPSMEFSRQEYWSRLPFSSPGLLSFVYHQLT